MRNTKGSEVFNTSVMKTEEVILFVKAAMEGGSDLDTAHEDMKMIDSLLHMQRLHISVHGFVKRTRSGGIRKGTSLYNSMDGVINARVKGLL
jgi:hypothetical protein